MGKVPKGTKTRTEQEHVRDAEIAVWLTNLCLADKGIDEDRERYREAIETLEQVALSARDLAFEMRRQLTDGARRQLTTADFWRHPLLHVYPTFHSTGVADQPNPNGDGTWKARIAHGSCSTTAYSLLHPERIPPPPGDVLLDVSRRCRERTEARLRALTVSLRTEYLRANRLAEEWERPGKWPWAGLRPRLRMALGNTELPTEPVPDDAGPDEIERLALALSSVALAFEAESLAIPTDEDLRSMRRGTRGKLPKKAHWREFGKWMKEHLISARRVARHPVAADWLIPDESERQDEDALRALEKVIAKRTGA
jgi:hypothetical protein